MSSIKQVAIIGGGIAGLSAARYLKKKNIAYTLFEKSNSLGGRIKTQEVDGFLLDEGFQVLLNNYEEVSQLISYESLKSSISPSGAVIRINERWYKMGNPLKNIGDLWTTLINPAGSIKDKWLIFTLSQKAQKSSNPWEEVKNISTLEFLTEYGFSTPFIDHFFKPFFGGVFLDYELHTSASLFYYLFGKFYSGEVTLPQYGMGDLIKELSAPLDNENIHLNTEIKAIQGTRITLASGKSLGFDKVIDARNSGSNLKWNGTRCFYFSCDTMSKKDLGYLHLNPMGKVVRHVAILNRINPNYSPKGKDLLSVTVKIENESNYNEVAVELKGLFGNDLKNLTFLKVFDLPYSLPVFRGKLPEIQENELGQIIIGDSTQYPSINGAIASGRMAAELI